MKRIAIPALAALALTSWVPPVAAQQTEQARGGPPPHAQESPFTAGPEARPGRPGMQARPGGPRQMREMRMHAPSPFHGLIFPRRDKALTASEGQKIAEAILIWHGERDWKVSGVTEVENAIRFDFATGDGGVIARFIMDRRTGRIIRLG